ncbi:hypothetical protein Pelo_16953 [Pelomyxa schiedti]|nr:hypothetical protein Pelo_16953 [Pelomyxa schiedti]
MSLSGDDDGEEPQQSREEPATTSSTPAPFMSAAAPPAPAPPTAADDVAPGDTDVVLLKAPVDDDEDDWGFGFGGGEDDAAKDGDDGGAGGASASLGLALGLGDDAKRKLIMSLMADGGGGGGAGGDGDGDGDEDEDEDEDDHLFGAHDAATQMVQPAGRKIKLMRRKPTKMKKFGTIAGALTDDDDDGSSSSSSSDGGGGEGGGGGLYLPTSLLLESTPPLSPTLSSAPAKSVLPANGVSLFSSLNANAPDEDLGWRYYYSRIEAFPFHLAKATTAETPVATQEPTTSSKTINKPTPPTNPTSNRMFEFTFNAFKTLEHDTMYRPQAIELFNLALDRGLDLNSHQAIFIPASNKLTSTTSSKKKLLSPEKPKDILCTVPCGSLLLQQLADMQIVDTPDMIVEAVTRGFDLNQTVELDKDEFMPAGVFIILNLPRGGWGSRVVEVLLRNGLDPNRLYSGQYMNDLWYKGPCGPVLTLKFKQEESRPHYGVICSTCHKRAFTGLRHACTECSAFDQCDACFIAHVAGPSHPTTHNMKHFDETPALYSVASACILIDCHFDFNRTCEVRSHSSSDFVIRGACGALFLMASPNDPLSLSSMGMFRTLSMSKFDFCSNFYVSVKEPAENKLMSGPVSSLSLHEPQGLRFLTEHHPDSLFPSVAFDEENNFTIPLSLISAIGLLTGHMQQNSSGEDYSGDNAPGFGVGQTTAEWEAQKVTEKELADILIKKCCDPNGWVEYNGVGGSLLHLMALEGFWEREQQLVISRLLLEAGADPSIRNTDGNLAAELTSNYQLQDLLQSYRRPDEDDDM